MICLLAVTSPAASHELGQGEAAGAGLVVGEHDAVAADHDLGDGADAVALAGRVLGWLDPARGVGEVGEARLPMPAQEQPHALPVPVLDHGRLEAAAPAELLGHGGGEREHGRGADYPNWSRAWPRWRPVASEQGDAEQKNTHRGLLCEANSSTLHDGVNAAGGRIATVP
ncbi:MAG: hypothetical protein U1E17_04850 [Geminicoccaceae bacterium]